MTAAVPAIAHQPLFGKLFRFAQARFTGQANDCPRYVQLLAELSRPGG